jgi:PiT family inorganic phosphate transporter
MFVLVLAGTALLTFANGANDNFQGVATLYGGHIASYRLALAWATITTFFGCFLAVWIADGLAQGFSGKGILPDSMIDGRMAASIALAAGGVVLLATVSGMPISTTHALLGGLTGAAIFTQGWNLPWAVLGIGFFLPLAASPTIALGVAWIAVRFAPISPSCVCVEPVPTSRIAALQVTVDAESSCEARGATKVVSGRSFVTALHFLSGGAVSLARGLNDAPKLAAILLATSFLEWNPWMLAALGLTMAAGGLLGSTRVARTMSHDLTPMSDAQGFAANVVTSTLVLAASFFSLPVSTTHVSCGALAGLGLQARTLSHRRFAYVLFAWLFTLPAAALFTIAILAVL